MKNKLTFPLICCIAITMAACGGSSKGKPMSAAISWIPSAMLIYKEK